MAQLGGSAPSLLKKACFPSPEVATCSISFSIRRAVLASGILSLIRPIATLEGGVVRL